MGVIFCHIFISKHTCLTTFLTAGPLTSLCTLHKGRKINSAGLVPTCFRQQSNGQVHLGTLQQLALGSNVGSHNMPQSALFFVLPFGSVLSHKCRSVFMVCFLFSPHLYALTCKSTSAVCLSSILLSGT